LKLGHCVNQTVRNFITTPQLWFKCLLFLCGLRQWQHTTCTHTCR